MILKASEENIQYAANEIRKGGIVAFPTETVYGLGANGLNPLSVAKIFEAKNRPTFNPLILHIAEIEWLNRLCKIENEKIFEIIERFWPGPLTLILKKKEIVPDIVTAGNETVAIRMPDHRVALKLIEYAQTPVAAPSANAFGFLSPTEAIHVEKQLGERVDLILDGGKCSVGVESTIIEVTGDRIIVLRHGGIESEEIAKIAGGIEITESDKSRIIAPGQLDYHYSPRVPLRFIDEINIKDLEGLKVGALFFKNSRFDFDFEIVRILSDSGNTREAAANLFSFLHEIESSGVDLILAEKVPGAGLGTAIMERLTKASRRYMGRL